MNFPFLLNNFFLENCRRWHVSLWVGSQNAASERTINCYIRTRYRFSNFKMAHNFLASSVGRKTCGSQLGRLAPPGGWPPAGPEVGHQPGWRGHIARRGLDQRGREFRWSQGGRLLRLFAHAADNFPRSPALRRAANPGIGRTVEQLVPSGWFQERGDPLQVNALRHWSDATLFERIRTNSLFSTRRKRLRFFIRYMLSFVADFQCWWISTYLWLSFSTL